MFHARGSAELRAQYLLFLPEEYGQDKRRRWPLMLFLHGAGERGTDLVRVATHGPPRLVKTQPDFPFILVSPQCPAGQTWNDDVLLALLNDIERRFLVDSKRVYLTGISMGGYGAWSLGLTHPSRFAALVPICGGGSTLPILLAPPGRLAALKKLPVWAFHGGRDDVVLPSESERLIQALRQIGNDARLTLYPHAGHDAWTETYHNPELYRWLLAQSRATRPKPSDRRPSIPPWIPTSIPPR